jgi:hypothetical protein
MAITKRRSHLQVLTSCGVSISFVSVQFFVPLTRHADAFVSGVDPGRRYGQYIE